MGFSVCAQPNPMPSASPHFVSRASCPACGAADSQERYRRPYTAPEITQYLHDFYDPQGGVEFEYLADAQFILQQCDNCALVYQEEIPNEALMTRLYEQWLDPAKVFAAEMSGHDLGYFQRDAFEIQQLISWFGKMPSELNFFDFGMGWAVWCRMAAAFGVQASGTELSDTRIAHAKRHGIGVLTWDEIPGQDFDFINTEQVFEHIPAPLDTLKHLSLGLRPGGLVKVSVPEGRDIGQRMAKMDWQAPKGSADSLNAVAPLEHINCFNHDTIIKMGAAAGLVPVALPLGLRYRFQDGGGGLKGWLKKAVRPLYHHFGPKRTYVWLQKR